MNLMFEIVLVNPTLLKCSKSYTATPNLETSLKFDLSAQVRLKFGLSVAVLTTILAPLLVDRLDVLGLRLLVCELPYMGITWLPFWRRSCDGGAVAGDTPILIGSCLGGAG